MLRGFRCLLDMAGATRHRANSPCELTVQTLSHAAPLTPSPASSETKLGGNNASWRDRIVPGSDGRLWGRESTGGSTSPSSIGSAPHRGSGRDGSSQRER